MPGRLPALAAVAALAASLAAAETATRTASGNASYMTHCAVCHGISAKGDGPLADSLRVTLPDLTLIAKRNGGRFEEETIRRIIDGRKPVRGHGGPEMPVWGDAFKSSVDGYSDAAVREKVMGLVAYLRSLQAPGK